MGGSGRVLLSRSMGRTGGSEGRMEGVASSRVVGNPLWPEDRKVGWFILTLQVVIKGNVKQKHVAYS